MKGVAIASVLVLGSAASFTAIAANRSDNPPDVERGVKTLRVESRVDNTCQIWINGSLRATIGSFGDSGILSPLGGQAYLRVIYAIGRPQMPFG
jgi:hypothetical protein